MIGGQVIDLMSENTNAPIELSVKWTTKKQPVLSKRLVNWAV